MWLYFGTHLVVGLCIFVGRVSSQSCTATDFSITYEAQPVFTVSSVNDTCICRAYSSTGNSFLQTLTTSSLTVTGPASVAGGLSVAGGGVTVANGQTVNLGTSLSSTPLNVWGPATFRNGVTVASGGLTVSNGAAVSIGTSGSTTPLAVFGPVSATWFTGNGSSLTGLSAQAEFAALTARVNSIQTGGSTGANCLLDTDCQSPRVCHRGACKLPLGASCTSHQQCMSDVHGCNGGVCGFYRSCSAMRTANPGAVSGWYPIVLSSGRRMNMWCNFETAAEGWTVAWSNHRGGGKPMTNMPWASAISGAFLWTAARPYTMPNVPNPEDTGVFTGLSFWAGLAPRGKLRYDWSPDYGQPISQSHECDYTLTGATYVINFANCVQRVGSVQPGLVGTHGGRPFSTYDQDNDAYAGACSLSYSGSPWWYVQCWSGNINGGGEGGNGHMNAAYWTQADAVWGTTGGIGGGNGWILLS